MSKTIFSSEPERIIKYKDLTKDFKEVTPPFQNDCVMIYATNSTDSIIHICSTIDYTEGVLLLKPGDTCIKDLNMGKKIKNKDPYFCWKKGNSFYIRWVEKTPTKGTVNITMIFLKERNEE